MGELTEEEERIQRAIEILRQALSGQASVSKNTLIKEAIKVLEK